MTSKDQPASNLLLVAKYESDIGYAWWLMECYWAALASHFHSLGQTSFLIFPKLGALSDRILESPIVPAELDFRDRTPMGMAKLRSFVKKNNIKTVYLTDQAYLDTFFARLRLWGVKRIILHDHTPGERPRPAFPKRTIKTALHRIGLFSCDHYIGVSRFVRDRLISNACIQRERCSYVYNGINPIPLSGNPSWYAHDAFGFPRHAKIVVTTGRVTTYKGLDLFIDCAETLVQVRGNSNLFFLHCGDGPEMVKFQQMVRDRGLEHVVILAGRRSDIAQILPSCSIAIQTSLGEAFSLSILEYMSAGLATLAPANCGNGEVISHGETGFLYPPRDIRCAVSRIEELLSNTELRDELGRNARNLVNTRFTLDEAMERLVSTVGNAVQST